MRFLFFLSMVVIGLSIYSAEGLQLIGLILCLFIICVQFLNYQKDKNRMVQLTAHYCRLNRFIQKKYLEFPALADENKKGGLLW